MALSINQRYRPLSLASPFDPDQDQDGPDYRENPETADFSGGDATGPAKQLQAPPDPEPNLKKKSAMDDGAGKVPANTPPPMAGGPIIPGTVNVTPDMLKQPGDEARNDEPARKAAPASMAGFGGPKSPFDLALEAAQQSAAMKREAAPKNNLLQTIGQTVLGMTNLGPTGAAALMHPKYTAKQRVFDRQKMDLADTVNTSEKLANLQSLDANRLETADTREQNAITAATKQGIVFLPQGSTPPGELIPTINPMAGRKGSPYADAVAYRDPHFGQFLVTNKQAQLSNGALDGQIGKWLPMSELTPLVKAGTELGKPVKETTVPVTVATARALHVEAKPNAEGFVEVPISLLNGYNTAGDKQPPINQSLLSVRAAGKTTGNKFVDEMTPEQAKKALLDGKERPSNVNVNQGTFRPMEDADGNPVNYNNKTGLTSPNSGVFLPGTKEKRESSEEKKTGPSRDALAYASQYGESLANGLPATGSKDEILLEKFFEIAKPTSGFRMSQPQIDLLQKSRGWMSSMKAQIYHSLHGTWFDDDQRREIIEAMQSAVDAKGGVTPAPGGGGRTGGNKSGGGSGGNKSAIDPTLKAYADKYFGGNIEKAKAYAAQE